MPFDFSVLVGKTASLQPRPPVFIAEIGTGHGGDLEKGLDLIDAAADSGAQVAKVQVVFAHEILPPQAGLVPLPGGDTPLFNVFQALERPLSFYARLAERAEQRGMGFLASPFGEQSVRLLEDIGVQAWKVASPELNHEDLLERLSGTGLPLILSTGVSKLADIERAMEVIAGTENHNSDVVLLHCLTNYPAPENESNLRVIPSLSTIFGVPVGVSDHTLHPVLVPALATALGAAAIEKHITLDRNAGGLDDPVALNPDDFALMCRSAARFFPPAFPASKSNGYRVDENHLARVVEELSSEYGKKRVEAILGDGVKRLANSEKPHYGRTNRSLHALGPLDKGTVLSEKNTAILRTEKILDPGVEPRYRHTFYGRRLTRDVAAGNGISWDDILSPR